MTQLIVDFLNFANAPKNSKMSLKRVFMFFVVISEKQGYFLTQDKQIGFIS